MTLEEELGKYLIENKLTIATAESCTGGLLSSKLTDVSGSSEYVKLNFVTYANEAKHKILGVSWDILNNFGAVSEECAEAMAKTAMKNLNTDIGIGITGTTGNLDPNNADSIQGKAFFCIAIHGDAHIFEISADVTDMNRHAIKKMYADKVFEKLSELI